MIMRASRIIILLFLGLFFIFVVVLCKSYPFLAYNNPVKSNYLVVEGWLNSYELEQIVDDKLTLGVDKIVVVGYEFPDGNMDSVNLSFPSNSQIGDAKVKREGRWLFANSTLVFNPDLLQNIDISDSLLIKVQARGTSANKRFAHFSLIINGKFAGDSFAAKRSHNYYFSLSTPFEKLHSLMIRFDNDCGAYNEDRNLFIYSIMVNGKQIIASKETATIMNSENRYTTGFTSRADETANYLKVLGIDAERIKSVAFEQGYGNQTLLAALSCEEWILLTDIRSFNLISAGVHSRRSWITYKTVFGDSFKVGIISLEPMKYKRENWWKSPNGYIMMIDELFSYLFNWLSLKF